MDIRPSAPLAPQQPATHAGPFSARVPEPQEPSEEYELPSESCCPGQVMTRAEVLQVMAARDAEVRAHEGAHHRAAGQWAQGGPLFEMRKGPDGRFYAIAGKVLIDASEVAGDARATIEKMKQVYRAAMAPDSHLSAADLSVAADARQKEAVARRELQDSESRPPSQADPQARAWPSSFTHTQA